MSDFTKIPGQYHLWFDSLEELEREVPKLIEMNNPQAWRKDVMDVRRGHDWFGCRDAVTAMNYIREGWPELRQKLQPKIDILRSTFQLDSTVAVHTEVRRRKRQRSDHGDTLDITKVWNGDLEHAWERPVRFPRMSQSQKYATIYADIGVSCVVSAEDTLWRAAAIHCMLEMLTRMGVNTEVWSGNSLRQAYPEGPRQSWTGVRIKQFTQPLNEDRLATMLCSVFFRTWLFGTIMAAPWRVAYNLGYPLNEGFVKPLRDRQEAGERVFRLGNCLNEYSAQAEVQRIINELQKKEAA